MTPEVRLLRRYLRSFAPRLVVGLLAALAVVGLTAQAVVAERLEDHLLAEGLQDQLVVVDRLGAEAERAADAGGSGPVLSRLVDDYADRAHVLRVEVIDQAGETVVRSGPSGHAADHRRDALTLLTSGRAGAAVRGDGEDTHFQYAVPLWLGDVSYVLVVDTSPRELQAIVATVRQAVLEVGLPAALVALVVFWLTAGRTLSRRHRFALERATRDGLTDLGNHRAFQDELDHAGALAQRVASDCALLVLDVDDFKALNDTRGHHQGDEVLRRVATALRAGRAQDRPFRTGGDEFAVLLHATTEADALVAARRVRGLLERDGIRVSVGVSATRPGMRDAVILREEADAALHDAKRRRADAPVAFSEIRGRADVLTPEKAHAVRRLVESRAVDVAFQPIWDLAPHALLGFEALARPDAALGLQGPAEAFDVAEQIDCVRALDLVCVEQILGRAGDVPDGALLFVNISPSSLDGGVTDAAALLSAARAAGVAPERVVIEVTERTGAQLASVVRGVRHLRGAGFRVAIDDVGAGNSGLELLRHVEVDFVKVDRGVVVGAMEDGGARAVLSAIFAFAAGTGAHVIVEGIEDDDVLGFVLGLEARPGAGLVAGQGYRLGRPAPTVAAALAGARAAADQSAATA